MNKVVALICLVVAASGIAAANFHSSSAIMANGDYRHAVEVARTKYVAALKRARNAAMEKNDLDEANAIDAEIKRYSQNDASDEPPMPLTDKNLYDAKLNFYAFPDTTMVFNRNGTVDGTRPEYKGEKFWKLGNDGILRLSGPDAQTLTSQYISVRRGDMVFWIGQTTDKNEPRILVQQTH
jgi:hypothetical protein